MDNIPFPEYCLPSYEIENRNQCLKEENIDPIIPEPGPSKETKFDQMLQDVSSKNPCTRSKDCPENKLCLKPEGEEKNKDVEGKCVPKMAYISTMKSRMSEEEKARRAVPVDERGMDIDEKTDSGPEILGPDSQGQTFTKGQKIYTILYDFSNQNLTTLELPIIKYDNSVEDGGESKKLEDTNDCWVVRAFGDEQCITKIYKKEDDKIDIERTLAESERIDHPTDVTDDGQAKLVALLGAFETRDAANWASGNLKFALTPTSEPSGDTGKGEIVTNQPCGNPENDPCPDGTSCLDGICTKNPDYVPPTDTSTGDDTGKGEIVVAPTDGPSDDSSETQIVVAPTVMTLVMIVMKVKLLDKQVILLLVKLKKKIYL